MLLANRLLNDWTGYRVFTNVLEIRQTFELQTDRGTESSTFQGEIHLWSFLQKKNYRPEMCGNTDPQLCDS
jgi:hypothetical protein